MVRLSDIMEKYTSSPGLGLLIYGYLGDKYKDEEKEEGVMDGLCPQRILLNDDWLQGIQTVEIEPAEAPFTSYAYYPPEFIRRKVWTTSCTVFALCAIIYRLTTGELPYVGDVPEELLATPKGLNFLAKERLNGLDLEKVPSKMRKFLSTGLMLQRSRRYQSLGESEKAFSDMCDNEDLLNMPDPKATEVVVPAVGFNRLFTEKNDTSDFTLEVLHNVEGGLNQIVGLEEQKNAVASIVAMRHNPERAAEYKLTLNGLLLYGPPGVGKSYFAKMLGAEIGGNIAYANAQSIASSWVHGTQKLICELFKQAALNAPITLILNEAESMMQSRANPENAKVSEETNAFLSEIDTCAERGIFLICTSNYPQLMDSSILRSGRFDKKLYIPLPDEQTRLGLFKMYLHDRPIEANIDYAELSKLTSGGYVSSDICTICNAAAEEAFLNNKLITQDLLEQVIYKSSPSVNKNEIRTYEEARKYIEPAAKYTPYINQIGFR